MLVAAAFVATAWVHPVAMDQGLSHQQVLANQQPGCATTTCPKKIGRTQNHSKDDRVWCGQAARTACRISVNP
jgi:hypothetical protein